MQNTYGGSTLLYPNLNPDLAKDQAEKKLNHIKGKQAMVDSLMYAALATWPDI
jgi:hypothetical protein